MRDYGRMQSLTQQDKSGIRRLALCHLDPATIEVIFMCGARALSTECVSVASLLSYRISLRE